MPERRFNTAGPCRPELHYMLPPERRLASSVRALVDGQTYFVVHAPRQSGKTTSFDALARTLTKEGRYAAALLSLEVGAWSRDDPGKAENAILGMWANDVKDRLPPELRPPPWPERAPGNRIALALAAWAETCSRPLVLFLDEADALQDQTLVSTLRQLRSSFANRPKLFPWSVALIGLRDVRDYLVQAGGSGRMGSSSPFNIKSESITLRDFTAEEVAELYLQHTADTAQTFSPEALARAFELGRGQPWLSNALARQLTETLVPDRTKTIDAQHVNEAAELLIQRQDTHLDSLLERLQDPRITPIIRAILLGDEPEGVNTGTDDFRFARDLGLVRIGREGPEIANPVYREILARKLSQRRQDNLPEPWWPWAKPDGRLDMPTLVDAFVLWWREHADALLESDASPYREAAAHLAFMGFLQRVVNGGGTIQREYAAARGRVDLLVTYKGERFAIELKRVRPTHDTLERAERLGTQQLGRYLASLGLAEGWLFIFDQRAGRTWDERCWRKDVVAEGRTLHLVGA
jgi:type II secretory pathway predicted ATPase ExeA